MGKTLKRPRQPPAGQSTKRPKCEAPREGVDPPLPCALRGCQRAAALVCVTCGGLCGECAPRHHQQDIPWHTAEPLFVTADICIIAAHEPPVGTDRLADGMNLTEALFRYNRWLVLHQRYPKRHLVPAADIEAVWRCHLLSPLRYVADTTALLGNVLPYDPPWTIKDEETWVRSFLLTSKLWRKAYQEEYEEDS